MKKRQLIRTFFLVTLIIFPLKYVYAQNGDSLVSPLKGSAAAGEYRSRFTTLTLLTEPLDSKKNPSKRVEEGALKSNIYKRPENVSDYEVFQSYKKVLENAGFDILLACNSSTCNTKRMIKSVYGYPERELENRPYKNAYVTDKSYLVGFGSYYISAKKEKDDKTYFVMIIISNQRGLYSVDVLEVETMPEGTVSLAPELLNTEIKDQGKAVLQGIFFETGKSIITDESTPSLNAIATYLKDNPQLHFYVVGHTDDTGDVNHNISLSKSRAHAVVDALKKYGVNTSRLLGYGVGPFSPAATNQTNEGKKKNRRVELVLRIK
jgi:flagellar motor protein MotB